VMPESCLQADDRMHDRLAELAQQLHDLKGNMDAFSVLMSALEEIIPMILHVQYVSYPPSKPGRWRSLLCERHRDCT
jgi:hypothetical protein